METLSDVFNAKFEQAVRWNNRFEKEIASAALELCDDLNLQMDGVLEFEINSSYFKDNAFKLDCVKADTGAQASVLIKVHGDLMTLMNDDGAWQAMSDRSHESAIQRYTVEFFARKFAEMEQNDHVGIVFQDELRLS